jgi:hypothetical protein
MADLTRQIADLLAWERQFGYTPGPGPINLDALNDGFDFDLPDGGRLALEMVRPDVVWREDPGWLLGMLSIARRRTVEYLAIGRRYFTLLVIPERSPLLGQLVGPVTVPWPDGFRRWETRPPP